MGNKPQLYKFTEIEHRLHTLEPGQTYIKPFVTSKVSDTMCGGLNFLNKVLEFVPILILFSYINFITLIDLLLLHVHEDQEMRTLYPQSSLELETK